MLSREGNFYSAESEAVIIDLLKGADRMRSVPAWWNTLFVTIRPRFGLYFAEIEQLSRRHGLFMHLFAVPEEVALKGKIDLLIVDPNDRNIPRPFLAMCYPNGLDDLISDARELRVLYEPTVNLINLEEAGIGAPISGTNTAQKFAVKRN